jgi:nucleoside-diphosphate-sugar epimerase
MRIVVNSYTGVYSTAETTPNFVLGVCDVRQVAQAHVAALSPGAKGRYLICSEKAMDIVDVFATISEKYPGNKFPTKIEHNSERLEFDCSKALRELGLNEFFPVSRMMIDTIEGLKVFGAIE